MCGERHQSSHGVALHPFANSLEGKVGLRKNLKRLVVFFAPLQRTAKVLLWCLLEPLLDLLAQDLLGLPTQHLQRAAIFGWSLLECASHRDRRIHPAILNDLEATSSLLDRKTEILKILTTSFCCELCFSQAGYPTISFLFFKKVISSTTKF